MNVKINKEVCDYLMDNYAKNNFVFGSHLHGVANENSDTDYIIILDNLLEDNFNTIAKYLPNIHSYQFDDIENNSQLVLMTEKQFYQNLFSGDGNMVADVVILNDNFKYLNVDCRHDSYRLFLTKTYRIIKGYLGVAKRDIKIHGNNEKKRFHAVRSLYMAEELMNNRLPTVNGIQELRKLPLPDKEDILVKEDILRNKLNKMLDDRLITHYPKFEENNEAIQIMNEANNVINFKYES